MTFIVEKDPQAVLNYGFDWSSWLPSGDPIVTSTWAVSGPDVSMAVDSDDRADGVTEAVVSGGTLGRTYYLVNTIETTAGLTDQRTISVTIKNR